MSKLSHAKSTRGGAEAHKYYQTDTEQEVNAATSTNLFTDVLEHEQIRQNTFQGLWR